MLVLVCWLVVRGAGADAVVPQTKSATHFLGGAVPVKVFARHVIQLHTTRHAAVVRMVGVGVEANPKLTPVELWVVAALPLVCRVWAYQNRAQSDCDNAGTPR